MTIDVSVLVATTPPAAEPLQLRLPGGVVLSSIPQTTIPDAAGVARALLAQANSALAPLAPALRLVDFAITAFNTISSVPTVIVDPAELIENIEKLAKTAAALASFVPAVSVPALAGDFVDLLIANLQGLVSELEAIQELQVKIAAADAQKTTYPALTIVIAAAENDVAVHVAALNTGLGPLGTLIRLANLILSIAGISALPEVASIGSDTEGAIEGLQTAILTLRTIRATLPV